MALPASSRLGPYEIESLIGASGMGEVYRARAARLNRQLAVAPDSKSAVCAYLQPDSQIWMMEQVKER